MRYLEKQLRLLRKTLARGIPIADSLTIKYYVQTLMATEIRSFLSGSDRVLEVGAGGSLAIHFLSNQGLECFALDISHLSKEYHALLRRELNSEVKFVRGNALCLPFPNDAFDYVYSVGLIEHFNIPEQRAIVAEMARCTRRYLHLEVPNYKEESAFWAVRAMSDEEHLPCDICELMDWIGAETIKHSGRAIFSPSRLLDMNEKHRSFVQIVSPATCKRVFRSEDVDTLISVESSLDPGDLCTYGFQTYVVGLTRGIVPPQNGPAEIPYQTS